MFNREQARRTILSSSFVSLFFSSDEGICIYDFISNDYLSRSELGASCIKLKITKHLTSKNNSKRTIKGPTLNFSDMLHYHTLNKQ